MIRDLIGCGFFFTAYDYTLRYFTPNGLTRDMVKWYGVLAAGRFSGIAYWSCSYPIDFIKTRM